MSAPIISSMALGRARTAAVGAAEPYYWFINGRATSDVREDDKDVGIPGNWLDKGKDYSFTTLDGLTTESVRQDYVAVPIDQFNVDGSDLRLARYSFVNPGAHDDGWFSFTLPAGNYIVNSAHGTSRIDGSDAIMELWDGTGNVTDGDRSLVVPLREFAVGTNGTTDGAVCDIQCDATYTFNEWLALDLVARGEAITVTDRGSAAATGIRYYMNKANATINNNYIRLSYVRIWSVI